jgi:hypothetical protein
VLIPTPPKSRNHCAEVLAPKLADQVDVVTKPRLAAINGTPQPNVIARCREAIFYIPDRQAFVLLDYDPKGMPAEIAKRIEANGGFWKTLVGVFPALGVIARLERRSTSAGISRSDTGELFPGSGGVHVYLEVQDGADAVRFLQTLHERLWLADFGWLVVSKSGQMLERSIVDRMVGAPERLVFEGAPVLQAPLMQDAKLRAPKAVAGDALDTIAAFPPLTIVERARFKELRAQAAEALKPEVAAARKKFVAAQAKRLVDRHGIDAKRAEAVVLKQCSGILYPHIALAFDDDEFPDATVADVLADPEKFAGATLADPIEGVDYGRCKAIVMLREDGTPWIHSFAHGRTVYQLHYDAQAVRQAIEKAAADDKTTVVGVFVSHMLNATISADEHQELLDLAAKLSGIGKRAVARTLKAEAEARERQRKQELRDQRLAARTDPRTQLIAPASDAPWLPTMTIINEVLAASQAPEPPMRDVAGYLVRVENRRVPYMHELSSAVANDPQPEDSWLPAPEQPLIERLDAVRAAELIERHIDYIDDKWRQVHLPRAFVEHYLKRDDGELPQLHGVVTQPIMLPDGTLLSGRGLDRKHHLVFRVPEELETLLPTLADCGPQRVAAAMRFLCAEWLVDVATTYAGKCTLISAALAILERTLLSERPLYAVTAGRRGSGKTTVLIMLLVATTGIRPSAAAWSDSAEERRKALAAYLMSGVSAIVWDNIERGTRIACPHIERSCTSAVASDRKLGVTELIEAATSPIHLVTGNNIEFGGDLSSRRLEVRVEVDRADPENRAFTHPAPVEWTLANRGKILAALYTLLLGNPSRTSRQAETRFKDWWRLCGSAVENAARQHRAFVPMDDWSDICPPVEFSFKDLFTAKEEDEEESVSLGEALEALRLQWPDPTPGAKNSEPFMAADVAAFLDQTVSGANNPADQRRETLRLFLFPNAKPLERFNSKRVGLRLRTQIGNAVGYGGKTLMLKARKDPHADAWCFYVRAL